MLGIPHPPGVPLYVLITSLFARAFAFAGSAASVALASALSTAAACGIGAALVAARTGSVLAGAAAGLCAGGMATVWFNATEAEVYAVALLLGALILWSAHRRSATGRLGWLMLTAYLMGLATPLHATALVAAPAAIYLASSREGGGVDAIDLLVLASAFLIGAGLATGSAYFSAAGVITFVFAMIPGVHRSGSAVLDSRPEYALEGERFQQPTRLQRLIAPALVVLGATCVMYLPARAYFDPFLNQGNPAQLAELVSVLARDQYDVASMLPRQAPLWLQAANYVQYLDWQAALGVAPDVLPSIGRSAGTIALVVLALVGLYRMHSRQTVLWRTFLVLLLTSSAGVLLYLNLKAGPSIGWGVLPDSAPHEVRERDYFFVLSFWGVGLAAGSALGWLLERFGRAGVFVALGAASLPLALNFQTASRRVMPEAALPRAFAAALLETAPQNAVLLVAGDNDTYPLWYLQSALGVRTDVAVVTIPLLGADWYREELERRYRLRPYSGPGWLGLQGELAVVSAAASELGRPLAVAVSVPADYRNLIADSWELRGFHYLLVPRGRLATALPTVNQEEVDRATAWSAPRLDMLIRPSIDPTSLFISRLMECPFEAQRYRGDPVQLSRLDSACNFR